MNRVSAKQACQIQELQLLQIQRLRQWLVFAVRRDGATVAVGCRPLAATREQC